MIVIRDIRKAAAHDIIRELGKEYFILSEPDDKLGIYPKMTCEKEISISYRQSDECSVMLESPKAIGDLNVSDFSDIRIY